MIGRIQPSRLRDRPQHPTPEGLKEEAHEIQDEKVDAF